MTAEKKQEYTLRITNANISELTVILCDMFIDYCDEAEEMLSSNSVAEFHNGINNARRVLSELINSLNRSIPLSQNVYQLYRYIERMLIKSDIKLDSESLVIGKGIMERLVSSYREVSSKDTSAPLMINTEEVYAGMTYGRNDLNSQSVSYGSRGFLA